MARVQQSILFCCLLVQNVTLAASHRARGRDAANPIRRIVTMLQEMENKVTEENAKMKELFDKAMCYCQTQGDELSATISMCEKKIPQLESTIKDTSAEESQLATDIKLAYAQRDQDETTLKQMTGIREKESGEFEKAQRDYNTNIKGLRQAINALKKGMAGGFLQTTTETTSTLKHLLENVDMSVSDSDKINAFLSADHSQGYYPQSGEIVGVLAQLLDSMLKDLKDIISAEETARTEYNVMKKAKTESIAALGKMIEQKNARKAEVSIIYASATGDLTDTQNDYKQSTAFYADLKKTCAERKTMWSKQMATRAEERMAITQAIKVLNDDDALELFKKTLATPGDAPTSFLQLKAMSPQRRALLALRKVHRSNHGGRLSLLKIALSAKKPQFGKLLKMIDDMTGLLVKEQGADNKKKKYCDSEISDSDASLKTATERLSDLQKSAKDAEGTLQTTNDDLATLVESVKALDKQVQEATELRKKEHDQYTQNAADNRAAKEIVGVARNALNKFYRKDEYDPTVGKVFVQTSEQQTPLEDAAEYSGQISGTSKQSNGIYALLDRFVADLDAEHQEMEQEEQNSQKEYEKMMDDSAAQRDSDARSISDKEATKAALEQSILRLEKKQKSKTVESKAISEYLKELHEECDWLLANYKIRKEARVTEKEALDQAKAVLSGAGYEEGIAGEDYAVGEVA